MNFQCAGITFGTVNGIGISLEIFFSGCKHDCSCCQNPELQNFSYGTRIDTDIVLAHLEKYNDFYNSIVFTGGDPLYQPKALYSIASNCNIPRILYTGFLYEEIPDYIKNVIDVIIDGPYIQELATDGFPASRNQHIWEHNNLTNIDFRK